MQASLLSSLSLPLIGVVSFWWEKYEVHLARSPSTRMYVILSWEERWGGVRAELTVVVIALPKKNS